MSRGEGQRPSPEQIVEFERMDREFRMREMPPQVDREGLERVCISCKSVLHPLHNRNYDATVGGFCNKLCMKDYERKLRVEGTSVVDADIEVSKYEDWKPMTQTAMIS